MFLKGTSSQRYILLIIRLYCCFDSIIKKKVFRSYLHKYVSRRNIQLRIAYKQKYTLHSHIKKVNDK